jgi:hypothetical protein
MSTARPGSSGLQSCRSTLSSRSTTDAEGSIEPVPPHSLATRLKRFSSKTKAKLLEYLRTKERTAFYIEYYNPNKEDRKDLKKIWSKLKMPVDLDPREGLQFEVHIPANNVCTMGTQGFKGLVDSGSRGYSLVKASVIDAIDETFVPIHNFPPRQQKEVKRLKGIGDSKPGSLEVLGSTVIQLFHPDAPNFTFHSKFLVVPDKHMTYDFLLGTDFSCSVATNFRATKKKVTTKSSTIGAVGLFGHTTILESVSDDIQPLSSEKQPD